MLVRISDISRLLLQSGVSQNAQDWGLVTQPELTLLLMQSKLRLIFVAQAAHLQ